MDRGQEKSPPRPPLVSPAPRVNRSNRRKSRLFNGAPVPILFADGHVRECSFFDTNSMTTEYEKGRWYGF